MKLIVTLLAAAAMVACSQAPSLKDMGIPTTAYPMRYVELCSNITVEKQDSDVALLAVSNCMGRVRGFADGHAVTIEFQKAGGADVNAAWCIDEHVNDRDVLTSVLSWVDQNHEEYDRMSSKYQGPYAYYGLTMKALAESFPCKQ